MHDRRVALQTFFEPRKVSLHACKHAPMPDGSALARHVALQALHENSASKHAPAACSCTRTGVVSDRGPVPLVNEKT